MNNTDNTHTVDNTHTSPEHYSRYAIQPSHFLMQIDPGWCLSNAIKYMVRWPNKHGPGDTSDLDKAHTYLEIHKHFQQRDPHTIDPYTFCSINEIHGARAAVIISSALELREIIHGIPRSKHK